MKDIFGFVPSTLKRTFVCPGLLAPFQASVDLFESFLHQII